MAVLGMLHSQFSNTQTMFVFNVVLKLRDAIERTFASFADGLFVFMALLLWYALSIAIYSIFHVDAFFGLLASPLDNRVALLLCVFIDVLYDCSNGCVLI